MFRSREGPTQDIVQGGCLVDWSDILSNVVWEKGELGVDLIGPLMVVQSRTQSLSFVVVDQEERGLRV